MKTAPFSMTCRINITALEAELDAYLTARAAAGKEPLKADVMTLIEKHTRFEELRPEKDNHGTGEQGHSRDVVG